MTVDEVRASDQERREVAEQLRAAAADGRIDFGELDARVEHALAASSRAELDQLVRDLPAGPPPAMHPGRRERRWLVLPIGSLERRGRWRVPERFFALFLLGGLNLDLSQAEIPPEGAQLTLIALIGGAELRVPPGIDVQTGGFSLLGGHDSDLDGSAPANAPRVRVRVYSLIGGVEVKSTMGGVVRPSLPA